MKRMATLALLLLLVSSLAQAQYLIPWQSVNSGGQPGSGSGYGLNGSTAQPVQGTGTATGYLGYWGFWIPEAGAGPGPSGWTRQADVPTGPKAKNVKLGGALAYKPATSGDYIYSFKGNNRCEFYRYDIAANAWTTLESIPAFGSSGKKKAVKKGAALGALPEIVIGERPYTCTMVYAVKGNGTLEFWRFDPSLSGTPTYPWTQRTEVPAGSRTIKEGAGMGRAVTSDTAFIYLLKGSTTTEFYRFNPLTEVWVALAPAPTGVSGKPFKNGSCITVDHASRRIYALKGTYGEFFAYDIDANTWSTLATLPITGSAGKKKVKDGAGIAYQGGKVYALKGGNTYEYWLYDPATLTWTEKENVPLGGGKKVKGGGALTATDDALYALKGNNTLEYYRYVPAAAGASRSLGSASGNQGTVHNGTVPDFPRLEVFPNPFSGNATITYSLPRAGPVSLKLYDVTGKLVRTLAEGRSEAGTCSFIVHRSGLSAGVYVLKLAIRNSQLGTPVLTEKLIIE